jgi:hypothetical protein
MRLKKKFQFGGATRSIDIYIHNVSCSSGRRRLKRGKRVHAANKCTLPHFRFNGSTEDSRATGGGVHRSMRYGWVQDGVVLEFPLPLNLRIIPNLPANQSGN